MSHILICCESCEHNLGSVSISKLGSVVGDSSSICVRLSHISVLVTTIHFQTSETFVEGTKTLSAVMH